MPSGSDIGTIYFLQSGKNGPIKIGFTTGRISDRTIQLQAGNPNYLSLRGYISDADLSFEKTLHDRFAEYSIRGEWFEAAPELLDYIRDL